MDTFERRTRNEAMARIRSSGTLIETRPDEMARVILGGRWCIDQNDSAMLGTHDAVVPSPRLAVLEHRLAKRKREVYSERV